MGTPKKPINKKVEPKSTEENDDDDGSILDPQPKKTELDDDDDFDGPLDDLGFENYADDEDDDY